MKKQICIYSLFLLIIGGLSFSNYILLNKNEKVNLTLIEQKNQILDKEENINILGEKIREQKKENDIVIGSLVKLKEDRIQLYESSQYYKEKYKKEYQGGDNILKVIKQYKPLLKPGALKGMLIKKQKGNSCFYHALNNTLRINLNLKLNFKESKYNEYYKTGLPVNNIIGFLKKIEELYGYHYQVKSTNILAIKEFLAQNKAIIVDYVLKPSNKKLRHAVTAYSFDNNGIYILDSLSGTHKYLTFDYLIKRDFMVIKISN